MLEEKNTYKLVEHNAIELDANNVGLVSRKNSGWAILDRFGYHQLLKRSEKEQKIPANGPHTKSILDSLWRSGLVELNGKTCVEQNGINNKPSNILIKLTDSCNYGCTYCYDHKGDGFSTHISIEKVFHLLEFVLSGEAEERITLSFHGGEPLLQFSKIKKIVEYVESHRKPNQIIDYSIQTNGSLLNVEVIEFLESHKFSVGISMDGNTLDSNRYRVGKKGQTPLEHFEALLENHQDFVRQRCGIMSVVSNASIDSLPSFALWLQERGVTALSLVLLQTMGKGESFDLNEVTAEQVIGLYKKLIKLIEEGVLRSLFIKNIISCLGNFLYFADGEVCYRGVCMASTNFLVISPDGSFKTCDCSDTREFQLGKSMDEVRDPNNPKRIAIKSRSNYLGREHPECRDCDVFGLCGGGCAARASTNIGGFYEIDDVECRLFKFLYQKFIHDYSDGKNSLFDYFRAYERQ